MIIINVKGIGEECADSDRYVKTVDGDTLANLGVIQNPEIILRPNYPLLVSMGIILIGSTAFVMFVIAYCLRKGWTISDYDKKSYRYEQIDMNIHHEKAEIFTVKNDFINNKSTLIDSSEDDLDNLNLDIQQDLVDSGERYLKLYSKRKMQHKNHKISKKEQV